VCDGTGWMWQILKERLKPRDEGLRDRTLLLRPANPHERGNAQWHIANRYLATKDRRPLYGRCGNQAYPTLTDILETPLHWGDLGILRRAELWQFSDHHLEAMRKPGFTTPVGMADAFHQLS